MKWRNDIPAWHEEAIGLCKTCEKQVRIRRRYASPAEIVVLGVWSGSVIIFFILLIATDRMIDSLSVAFGLWFLFWFIYYIVDSIIKFKSWSWRCIQCGSKANFIRREIERRKGTLRTIMICLLFLISFSGVFMFFRTGEVMLSIAWAVVVVGLMVRWLIYG